MKVDITYDKEFMVCSSDYPYELQLLKRAMTREISNAWMIKKKQPYLNTERCFINEYGMIPIGLWLYLLRFCNECNIVCEMTDSMTAYVNQFQLDYDQFKAYVDDMFDGALAPVKDKNGNPTGEYKPFKPREYQTKAAYMLLKYRKSCGEISTSAGKTLIAFIIFKFLVDTAGSNKILYIVPSVDLATQSADKYAEYESYLKNHGSSWEIGILKSGLKKAEKEKVYSCNILFGTYQSLARKEQSFFNVFSGCIIDECLHPDTLITMADGTKKKIADIHIGDSVYTINELTGEKEIYDVKKIYKNLSTNEQMYEIETDNGIVIRITGNHKVLTSNRGYVRADELNINDDIINFNEDFNKLQIKNKIKKCL